MSYSLASSLSPTPILIPLSLSKFRNHSSNFPIFANPSLGKKSLIFISDEESSRSLKIPIPIPIRIWALLL